MSKLLIDSEFWKRRGIPQPIPEFRFCNRLWRFDFYWDSAFSECEGVKSCTKVALEMQGGLFVRGGHSRGAAQMHDMSKYNAAQAMGIKVFQFTPEQLRNDLEIERYPKSYKGKRETVSEFLRRVLV